MRSKTLRRALEAGGVLILLALLGLFLTGPLSGFSSATRLFLGEVVLLVASLLLGIARPKKLQKDLWGWVILFAGATYPLILLCQGLFLRLLGQVYPLGMATSALRQGGGSLFVELLLYAILPAVCEECFFRGVLLARWEKLGRGLAIFMSSLAFSLFHFDLLSFVPPLCLGLLLGGLYCWRKSLGAVMVVHALHNALGIFFSRGLSAQRILELQKTAFIGWTGKVDNLILVVLGLVSIFAILGTVGAVKKLKREERVHLTFSQEQIFLAYAPLIGLVLIYALRLALKAS